MLWELVYTSRAGISDPERQIRAILSCAQRRNQRANITGLLLFDGTYFIQLMEGQKRSVEHAFERIKGDNRHADVHLLCSAKKVTRDFADWSMGFHYICTQPRMLPELTRVKNLQFGEPPIPSSTNTGVRMLRLVDEFKAEVLPPVEHDFEMHTPCSAI